MRKERRRRRRGEERGEEEEADKGGQARLELDGSPRRRRRTGVSVPEGSDPAEHLSWGSEERRRGGLKTNLPFRDGLFPSRRRRPLTVFSRIVLANISKA